MPIHRTDGRSLKPILVFGAIAALLLACGPNFPNRLLLSGDAAVLSAPTAEFKHEIERTLPKEPAAGLVGVRSVPPTNHEDVYDQSADADVADLRTALGPGGDDLVARYERVRRATTLRFADRVVKPAPADAPMAEVPGGLPWEFDQYVHGLLEFTAGRVPEARVRWLGIVEAPPANRHWRCVWAAFMLGKSYMTEDPARAIEWFHTTRDLAKGGFADTLGLGASSLGWEAKTELERGGTNAIPRAVDLYMEQFASGDPTALMSLRFVATKAFATAPADLDALARHLPTQRVVTAYIVSRGGPYLSWPRPLSNEFTTSWLAALERTGAADVDSADRLAWAAYQAGEFATCERWLKVAPAESPLAEWLNAKLLLRAGKPDEAAAMLAKASRAFPVDETWDWVGNGASDAVSSPSRECLGEAGVILLARRQYAEALDALLHAQFWTDGAYVAERVLTVDELKTYVDRAWPGQPAGTAHVDGWSPEPSTPAQTAVSIRHLLGRKLVRAGRYDEALAYMPAESKGRLVELTRQLHDGRDLQQSRESRAEALWAAAKLTRYYGLNLLGTELGPDAAIYAGQFGLSSTDEVNRRRALGPLVGADPDELERATGNSPDPDHRYHYRFVAARLGWEAAELMPDQDPATANVLWTAGSWIKTLDNKEADRFYKALVRRCGKTPLGTEADQLRWFPKGPDAMK
jgi:tetratricopeptide (TPR) repeat protein